MPPFCIVLVLSSSKSLECGFAAEKTGKIQTPLPAKRSTSSGTSRLGSRHRDAAPWRRPFAVMGNKVARPSPSLTARSRALLSVVDLFCSHEPKTKIHRSTMEPIRPSMYNDSHWQLFGGFGLSRNDASGQTVWKQRITTMTTVHHRLVLVRISVLGVLLFWPACPLWAAAPAGPERWEKAIEAFEAADQTAPPPRDAVLFIGSSTIVRWKTLAQDFPEHAVINRGFGGSQIADSTFYAERIVIPYRPRMIVLRAGGNDIHAGKTPEQVAADFEAFVEKVRARLPDVRIAYMTINASPARWANADREKKANELIREYIVKGSNLVYIDDWDAMLDADGKPREELFVQDRLHFNEAGYRIFADSVREHLPPRANPKLGMNLNGPADWNTDAPKFLATMRWARQRGQMVSFGSASVEFRGVRVW
jgi:lysophospholipase L1-like esterase